MTPHPHAEVLRAIADGQEVEYRQPETPDAFAWCPMSESICNPLDRPGLEWRVKPRTITRTIRYPAPETVAPMVGSAFWIPVPDEESMVLKHFWSEGFAEAIRWLKRGLVYLRREDAEARARAMLGEPNA